jgi:hypothetical protein
LSHEIEGKLVHRDEMKGMPYDKSDVIGLIYSIEACKVKFLNGNINAKRLYSDVDYALSLFRIKQPGFDYLKDPALNAYFS